MGRGARGVTAIKLGKGDFVVGADVIAENDKYILTVTENGIGKKIGPVPLPPAKPRRQRADQHQDHRKIGQSDRVGHVE